MEIGRRSIPMNTITNALEFIGKGLYYSPFILGLVWASVKFYQEQPLEQKRYSSYLVTQCMDKADGEDGVLSFDEGVKMTKDFGFIDSIYPGDQVRLKSCMDHAHFYVGNRKYLDIISHSQMEDYLDSLKPQKQIGFKYRRAFESEVGDSGMGIRFDTVSGNTKIGISSGLGTYDTVTGEHSMGPTVDF